MSDSWESIKTSCAVIANRDQVDTIVGIYFSLINVSIFQEKEHLIFFCKLKLVFVFYFCLCLARLL